VLQDLFKDQSYFWDILGLPENLTPKEIDDLTKTLALALYSEVGELVSGTNYKSHRGETFTPDSDKILFESVDVVRYIIAILNLWNISPEKFLAAWRTKDKYLKASSLCEKNQWNGNSVAIVDIDDVLCEFRVGFSRWLLESLDVQTDVRSSEYYFIDALEKTGLNPEDVFFDFISDDGFLSLEPVALARDFMTGLKDKGYFVHLLTARPSSNLRCYYNTFEWLEVNNIYFDKIDFSSEKLRWCMKSNYWTSSSIAFAIDDSPKHATEYEKHGIKVFSPKKSYNTELEDLKNCDMYTDLNNLLQIL
tara:strand:- start:1012 stop:1929 length:918 start_codon:yes stop_codon:yes gene_type:complete